MRWDRLTLTALGGIAVFLIGTALLFADGQALFAPVFGMVSGIAAMALANHERLTARVEALEKRLAQREWLEWARARWNQ
jgi:hypothetical protein